MPFYYHCNMSINQLKLLTLLWMFFFFQTGHAQSPTTYFDANAPNIEYLEHLIKVGVDEVRKDLGLAPLVNDSILYIAATDHAQFLSSLKRLTHYQSKNPSKRTPQMRAEYYGAKSYNVGENVASNTYGTSSDTYGKIAKSIVKGWVNSPGHYQNIITEKYEVTGVSVGLNIDKNTVFACQKFAHVELRFSFEENSRMFPYSNYVPPPVATSFKEVPNQLIPKYKYPYKLSHNKLEKCQESSNKLNNQAGMSLKYDKYRGYTLRIGDPEFVRNHIRNSRDGFAVEIVDYEDFACGSPFYYEKPSRRNGQLRLSGKTLEPLYRKDLFKGYKKRKKIKSIKFFPYIFRKDSVNFFRRFGQFRADRYSSEYFEIELGKLPKNSPRILEANLIVIKDKQICDVIYFKPYCGELFEDYLESNFIPYQYDDYQYKFEIISDEILFSIPFEQGQVSFEKEDILKNIGALSEYDFIIDSVVINAFSSVEGDSTINAMLQLKRAENIASIFQGIQEQEIEETITTSINWADLRKALKQNKTTRRLALLDDKALIKVVNDNASNLEPELASTRKGDVKVFFHVIPNLKSLEYYTKKESASLNSEIRNKVIQRKNYKDDVEQLADLYKYTYAMVKEGHLDSLFLLALELPREKEISARLLQYHLLFGFEYPTVFSKHRDWKNDSTLYINKFIKDDKTEFIPEFNYLLIKLISDDLIKKKSMMEREYKALAKFSENSKEFYFSPRPEAKINIDKINFNLNMLILNHFYKSSPIEHRLAAIPKLIQIHNYYDKYLLLRDTLALKLANMAVFYHNSNLAIDFLDPYKAKDDRIKALIHELGYTHPSDPYSTFYYTKLLIESRILPPNLWCNMFIKPCGIPFQAFDDEEIRRRYCELCEGENDYLNKVLFED